MSKLSLNSRAIELIKPFQVEDTDALLLSGKAVLGHKTGMGKTLMTLRLWSNWNFRKAYVLGSVSSTSVWLKQPHEWLTGWEAEYIEAGDPHMAKKFDHMLKARDGVFMMTYQSFERQMRRVRGHIETDVLVCEELHKLRKREAARTQAVMRVEAENLVGMSATWASRGPQDLWPIMSMIDRQRWASYWKWINTWCLVDGGDYGQEIYGIKNPEGLREYMLPHYRSRQWSEVRSQWGEDPVRRQPIFVQPSKAQRKLLDGLEKDLMAMLSNGDLLVTPSKLASVMRQRQILVCPRLVDPSSKDLGSGMEYVLDAVEDDPHTVIFVAFASVIPILEEELRSRGHEHIVLFKGGLKAAEINAREALFKKTRGIAIVSIPFAESFSLDTTHTAYFLGFEWDPNLNIQAEGRLRRLDSLLEEPVLVRYLLNEGTIEEHQKEVVNGKVSTVAQVFAAYTSRSLSGERA
jgi:hypothetical protein